MKRFLPCKITVVLPSGICSILIMASKIGREVKKYPKYLRSMHDIITSNYNAYKRHYDEIKFQALMKPEFEFEGKEFCMVIPKNTKEIINEGINNNNCLGSYVDKVIEGRSYIIFLRKVEEKENSLVTLEFRDGKIVQYKGAFNRDPDPKEMEFIESYCKFKKIQLV